jgi:hypothetical protein
MKSKVIELGDDVSVVASRLENLCRRDARRRARKYILRALNDGGACVGIFDHTTRQPRASSHKPAARSIHPLVANSIATAADVARSYERLAVDSLIQAQEAQDRVMEALQEENRRLRRENAELRERLDASGDPSLVPRARREP